MAGIKITDLPAAPSAQLTDVFPVDQGATTYKESNTQLLTLFKANGEALTKVDDTNVTMTLSGNPATALNNATSMSLGWTGQLSVSRGGTGLSSLTAHYLLIGNGTSSLTLLAPSAISGIPLISQGAASDPAYGTAVVAGGGTGNTTFTAYSVICAGTTATGSFQNVVGLGNAGEQLTSNGPGTLPTWQPSSTVTPSALTRVDDTNVTLTLGGTPTTALLQATSITAGWAGQLSLARGGTNKNITADNGALVYCDADSLELLAATPTAGQIPRSGANSAPTWSTATYPAAAGASGNVLASDGTNWASTPSAGIGSPLTTKGDLYTYSTVNARLAVGSTNGQMLQVNSGATTGLAWSTATYPSTVTANNILYASGSNVVGQLTPGTGVITALGQNVTGSGGIVLATSPTITTPTMQEINGSLLNRVFLLQDTASAVNSFIMTNSSTGLPPTITASGSDANVALYLRGTGNLGARVQGITSGTAIPAGYIGEYISANVSVGSKISLTTATPANVTSISLTAGDWDISWSLLFETASTTSVTVIRGGLNTATATVSASTENASQFLQQWSAFVPGVTTLMQNGARSRQALSGTTTIYLNAQSTFTINSMFVYGWLSARRVG